MIARGAVVVGFALVLWALSHADITLPALSLIGLVLWAVAASVLAVVLYRRGRTS
ncbi:MAG: hypothetical protein JWN52_7216 [Actinomycetia bacterium]|nr:hypothetical protein [Actinomycetes bacterium]